MTMRLAILVVALSGCSGSDSSAKAYCDEAARPGTWRVTGTGACSLDFIASDGATYACNYDTREG